MSEKYFPKYEHDVVQSWRHIRPKGDVHVEQQNLPDLTTLDS